MITIKELKEIIKDLPDEMPFGLIDLSTDDFHDCNYPLTKDNFFIEDYLEEEDGEVKGKMLFLGFDNKLNENPIDSESDDGFHGNPENREGFEG